MRKDLKRKEGIRPISKKIYIYCEGAKTECNYFRALKAHMYAGRHLSESNPIVKPYSIEGPKFTGESGAIKNITAIRNMLPDDLDSKDYVICVIDCDSNSNTDIEKAIKDSRGKNNRKCDIHICFSNPRFELWYLLHYQQCSTCLNEETLNNKLKHYNPDYKKNDPNHYTDLFTKQEEAIKHATELEKMHKKNGIELLSIESNPSTMVHLYITKIRELMQKSP